MKHIVLCIASIFIILQMEAQIKLKSDNDNGGITIGKEFGALVVTESTGKARHLVVANNGDIYVKLRKLEGGKSIIQLKDKNGDGKADETKSFGNYIGTGMALNANYLYASSDDAVYRYPMVNGEADFKKEEVVISEIPYDPQHEAKSITLDDKGNLFVNIGAPSNACQEIDRTKGSKGQDPCPLLAKFGGIWVFDANKTNQKGSDGKRYATGLRNCVALEWDSFSKQVFAVPHGRDQLYQLHDKLYTAEQGAELPSETFYQLKEGGDYGWPYCYYDHIQKKKIQAPEYGGDGKTVGRCGSIEDPIFAFPGHWAPNDLVFYHGNQFPERYKNGAFIAFHGSWNRAPFKQGGYFVAFVPFVDGKPSGSYEVFAENFAGGPEIKSPGDAKHRPMGLAEGPDGSLYIIDSVKGKIWRIFYIGKN